MNKKNSRKWHANVPENARRRLCTVHLVDEFRTTKLCLLCFRVLGLPNKQGRIHMKYRYYLCRNCRVLPQGSQAVGTVYSKKNNRLLSLQRHECPRPGVRMASKFRYYQKHDAMGQNVTWNRDTNAARNIRYKGKC